MNVALAAAGLCALVALPSPGMAESKETKSLEVMAAEGATTPEQHQALAAFYRQKAADARAVVRDHKLMAASYHTKSPEGQSGMSAHCAGLADAAQKEATEYNAMAAEHEEMANKAK